MSNDTNDPGVAVLGLGAMGQRMAARLLAAGPISMVSDGVASGGVWLDDTELKHTSEHAHLNVPVRSKLRSPV